MIDDFSALTHGRKQVVCEDASVLLASRTVADTAYILVHGAVEMVFEQSDLGLIVGVCAAPELLGADALFTRRPLPLTFRALGPVSYYRVERGALAEFIDRHPRAAQLCVQLAAQREEKVLATMQTLLGSADDRLAKLLGDYARYCGRSESGGRRLLIRRTQQDLSRASGLALRHVNRLMQRWKRSGHIIRDGSDLILAHHFHEEVHEAA